MSDDLDVSMESFEDFFHMFGVIVDKTFWLHENDYKDSDSSFGSGFECSIKSIGFIGDRSWSSESEVGSDHPSGHADLMFGPADFLIHVIIVFETGVVEFGVAVLPFGSKAFEPMRFVVGGIFQSFG